MEVIVLVVVRRCGSIATKAEAFIAGKGLKCESFMIGIMVRIGSMKRRPWTLPTFASLHLQHSEHWRQKARQNTILRSDDNPIP